MSQTTTVNAPATGRTHYPLLLSCKELSDRHHNGWFTFADLLTFIGENKATISGQLLDLIGSCLIDQRSSYPIKYRVSPDGYQVNSEEALEAWFWRVRGFNPHGFAALARKRATDTGWRSILYHTPDTPYLFAVGASYGPDRLPVIKRSDTQVTFSVGEKRACRAVSLSQVGEQAKLNASSVISAADYVLTGKKYLTYRAKDCDLSRVLLETLERYKDHPSALLVLTLNKADIDRLLDEPIGKTKQEMWEYVCKWEDSLT